MQDGLLQELEELLQPPLEAAKLHRWRELGQLASMSRRVQPEYGVAGPIGHCTGARVQRFWSVPHNLAPPLCRPPTFRERPARVRALRPSAAFLVVLTQLVLTRLRHSACGELPRAQSSKCNFPDEGKDLRVKHGFIFCMAYCALTAIASSSAASAQEAINYGPRSETRAAGTNHSLFWQTLCPAAKSGKPSGALAAAITQSFASQEKLEDQLRSAAYRSFPSSCHPEQPIGRWTQWGFRASVSCRRSSWTCLSMRGYLR